MKSNILVKGVIFFLILFYNNSKALSETPWETKKLSEHELLNLSALSESYGYIRYFYPNPNMESINWINFLIVAQKDLNGVKTNISLASKLQKIFKPLCPEVQFTFDSITLSELASPPYFVIENKGIGSYPSMAFGKDYSPIRHIESLSNGTIYQNKYCYRLQNNLFITFPLTLKELPVKTKAFAALKQRTDSLKLYSTSTSKVQLNKKQRKEIKYVFLNYNYRIADIIVRRNIITHFYPYFNEDHLNQKWDEVCMRAIKNVAIIKDLGFYYDELCSLLGNVHDSHMNIWTTFPVSPTAASNIPTYNDDITIGFCRDTCYVNEMGEKFVKQLSKGDLILAINDRPVQEIIDVKIKLISASTKASGLLRLAQSGKLFETYKSDSVIKLSVLKATGEKVLITLTTKVKISSKQKTQTPFLKRMDGNLLYMNLCSRDSFNYKNFVSLIPEIQESKGIILDVRGYPNPDILSLISHFIKENAFLGNLSTPLIRFPNRKNIEYIESEKWGIAPAISPQSKEFSTKFQYKLPENKTIDVPVVFLTDAKAQSFAETIMDMVKYYKIGTIIGEPTAGCNGDVTRNYMSIGTFLMTNNRFLNHDGSRHHGYGVLPDIYCSPIISDIQNGIDTQLEFSKKYLNNLGKSQK